MAAIAQMMVQPSSWVEEGIKISKVKDLYLFKFTEQLQARLDELSEKKKAPGLTLEEEAELAPNAGTRPDLYAAVCQNHC